MDPEYTSATAAAAAAAPAAAAPAATSSSSGRVTFPSKQRSQEPLRPAAPRTLTIPQAAEAGLLLRLQEHGDASKAVLNSSFKPNSVTPSGYGSVTQQSPVVESPPPQAAPAPLPSGARCIFPQTLHATTDVNKCDLRELIVLESLLGTGKSGIVYRITLKAGATARGLPLSEDAEYALKLVPTDDPTSRAEAHFGEILRRSNVPTINLVTPYFWMRWASTDEYIPWFAVPLASPRPRISEIEKLRNAVLYLIFMPLQRGVTLKAIGPRGVLTPVRGPPFYLSGLPFVVGSSGMPIRTLFLASVLAQLYAAFAAVRMVVPNFSNTDAHEGNLMLSKTGVPDGIDSITYRLPSGGGVFVPLQATGGFVLKMLDLGYAYGEYLAVEKDDSVSAPKPLPTEMGNPDPGRKDVAHLALFLFESFVLSTDEEFALLRMADRAKTAYPTYFVRALDRHSAFEMLRVNEVNRSTLDKKYAMLMGTDRLRNFDTLHVFLDNPGSTFVERVVAQIGAPLCHVCGINEARYHDKQNPSALYCGEQCFMIHM